MRRLEQLEIGLALIALWIVMEEPFFVFMPEVSWLQCVPRDGWIALAACFLTAAGFDYAVWGAPSSRLQATLRALK